MSDKVNFMGEPQSQQDISAQVNWKPETRVDVIKLPGIENLHKRPHDQIAKQLINVLKSRADIRELRWVVGDRIELTVGNR